MIKRFIIICLLIASAYVFFLTVRLNVTIPVIEPQTEQEESSATDEPTQKVFSFSFSKYTVDGHRELEIEGDSADIFAKVVTLTNVIAKAYANEKPVIITADKGTFDKSTSNVHLNENVVATSEEGTTLRSESLDIDVTKKVLSTEDVAKVEQSNIKLEGEGAHGDSELKKINFKKNVTVVISGEKRDSPETVITCDGQLEIDYMDNIARFNKNVIATDVRGKLTSDYMDVFYDKVSRRVYKIIARGNVVIEQEGNITYSDNVIYLANEGRVIMGGDPEAVYYPESEPFKDAPEDDESDYLVFNTQ